MQLETRIVVTFGQWLPLRRGRDWKGAWAWVCLGGVPYVPVLDLLVIQKMCSLSQITELYA